MNTNQQNPSRRTFLKAGAAVSTLAALGTQSKVFASNPGASDKLKVGLIGCGHLGRRLIKFLRPVEAEVWVYDPYLPSEMADALV